MAIAMCRECGKEVSDQAKSCPHCGVSKPVKKSVGLVQAAIVIAIGLFMVKACIPGTGVQSTPKEPASPFGDANMAKTACKLSLKSVAHDPESIEWIDATDWPTSSDGAGRWRVVMSVRAKNGFGALRLSNKVCTVALTADSYKLMGLDDVN